jgi:hypothetical protein
VEKVIVAKSYHSGHKGAIIIINSYRPGNILAIIASKCYCSGSYAKAIMRKAVTFWSNIADLRFYLMINESLVLLNSAS